MPRLPVLCTIRRRPQAIYWPLTVPFLLAAAAILFVTLALVRIGADAIAKLGISPYVALLILMASLAGSALNVPVGRIRSLVVAVNVGGAVVPAGLSGYLIVQDHLGWLALAAVAIVAVAVHLVARPVPGLGIAVPPVLPGIFAAGTAILLNPVAIAGLAYVGGTLGTLIGADLTNLRKVRGLGAPLVSIGGSGTFDGVFLAGIVAVLLTMLH